MKKESLITIIIILIFAPFMLYALMYIGIMNSTMSYPEMNVAIAGAKQAAIIIGYVCIGGIFATLIGNALYKKYLKHQRILLEKKRQEQMLAIGFSQVENLTPFQFEEWIARLMRINGYQAEATKKSGDYGVDIIAVKDTRKIAIQAKKYKGPVGIEAVQQVSSGKVYYGCNEAWVMTNSTKFTKAAIQLAEMQRVKLFSKYEMIEFLSQSKDLYNSKNNNILDEPVSKFQK
ncbi:MAG: restriction endonuclease [Clostridia bacterium]|nr:restriction endonuclease [Clostridia bacterium]